MLFNQRSVLQLMTSEHYNLQEPSSISQGELQRCLPDFKVCVIFLSPSCLAIGSLFTKWRRAQLQAWLRPCAQMASAHLKLAFGQQWLECLHPSFRPVSVLAGWWPCCTGFQILSVPSPSYNCRPPRSHQQTSPYEEHSVCTEPHEDLKGTGEEANPGFCSQEAQASLGVLVYTHKAIWKPYGIK